MPRQIAKRIRLQRNNFYLRVSFIAGFIFVILSVILRIHSATKLSFAKSDFVQSIEVVHSNYPVSMESPEFTQPINIIPTKIKNGIWEISNDGISRLDSVSNTILYAHNTRDRFGFLKSAKEGDQFKLKYQNGLSKTFAIRKIKIVSPREINSLFPQDPLEIVLYTCTGFADSQRLVVTASPVN